MREVFSKKIAFGLSRPVADRLQRFVNATGLDASEVVDHSLELFFESQPASTSVQSIRFFDEGGETVLPQQ